MIRDRSACWRLPLLPVLLATIGCSTITVRPVQYHLPDTALLPLNAQSPRQRSDEYGAMFCGVLAHLDGENGPWEECASYLFDAQPPDVGLPPLADGYRILVVSGILSQCFSPKLEAFSDALAHLRLKHGLTAEYMDVPALGSCEQNGEIIAEYIREHRLSDPRQYIVVGYSKGAPDLMVALAAHEETRSAVAALITVAGAVGGSRITDQLPSYAAKWFRKHKLPGCDTGDGGAIDSLSRPVRQQFLQQHPQPLVPTYALVAISDHAGTSRILQSMWTELSAYSIDQDGQVIASEGIAPGANFLGRLKGDHWAVALPVEIGADQLTRDLVNHNHFPRTALLEAAVRIVIRDLSAPSSAAP